MQHTTRLRTPLLTVMALLLSTLSAGAQNRNTVRVIKPFLKQHCIRCHGPNREEGGIRLDELKWDLDDLSSIEELQNVLDEIVVDSMPPQGEKRPSDSQLKAVTAALTKHITKAREKHSSGGGRPVRRLTKEEYVNTIYDLLGVEVDSSEMPNDGVVGGFDTEALDLFTTDMHLQTSFAVAQEAVTRFIASRSGSSNVQANEFFEPLQRQFGNRMSDKASQKVLHQFATLINRGRKVDKAFVLELNKNFRMGRKQGESFWEAMVTPMALTMCSMEAMFHFETRGEAADSKYVSPIEMVNRVSYFLWRSAPDAELIELAQSKKWYEPKVRAVQIRRMMADEKFKRFLDDFAVQWLELDRQDMIAVNERVYQEFNQDAKASLKRETIEFVSHIITNNLPLKNLIHSDFMMVNDVVAEHYGLPAVDGSEFRKIPVPQGSRRGGLLTQAGILMQTGTGDRTSIVERGAFVARKLLNDPPAPPPPLVDEIPSEGEAAASLTAAQLVKRHTRAPQCASCHRKIDGIGIGMEELDGVGLFRTVDIRANPNWEQLRKKQRKNPANFVIKLPLETSGRIAGKKFSTIEGLKKTLLAHDEELAEAYIEALLSMANGRKSGVTDQSIVEGIIKQAKEVDYPSRSILLAILQSDAFMVH